MGWPSGVEPELLDSQTSVQSRYTMTTIVPLPGIEPGPSAYRALALPLSRRGMISRAVLDNTRPASGHAGAERAAESE